MLRTRSAPGLGNTRWRGWALCLTGWLVAVGAAQAEDCYQYSSAMQRLRCENGKMALERKYDADNGYYIMQRWQNEVQREEQAREAAQQRNEQERHAREAARAAAEAYANSPEGKAEAARRERAAAEQFWRDLKNYQDGKRNVEIRTNIQKKLVLGAHMEALQRENRLYEIASKKGYLNEADYVLLAAAIAPDWQRMYRWVSEGKSRYGGRFELLDGVMLTMGCPEVDRVAESTKWLKSDQTSCDESYSERGNRIMLDYLPKASVTDQLSICSFMYSQLQAHQHFASEDTIRFIDNKWNGPWYRRNEARFKGYYEECASKAGKFDRSTLERHVQALAFYPYAIRWQSNYANSKTEPETQAGRWLMFNHPLLNTVDDYVDRRKVQQAVESSRLWSKYIMQRGSGRNHALSGAKQENTRLDWFFPTPEEPDDVQAEAEDRPVKREDPPWAKPFLVMYDEGRQLFSDQAYSKAVEKFQQGLAFAQEKGGTENDATQLSLFWIGVANAKQGASFNSQAIDYYKRSIVIGNYLYPKLDDLISALAFNNLANIYLQQKKFPEAIDAFQHAVQARRNSRPYLESEVANALNGLALAHMGLREWNKAEPYLRESLALYVKKLGESDQNSIAVKRNLDTCLQEQGKPLDAENKPANRKDPISDERYLAIHKEAVALSGQKDHAKAIEKSRQALAYAQTQGGMDSDATQLSLFRMGWDHRMQGEAYFDQAIDYYERSIAVGQQLYPKLDDPLLASALNNVGSLYREKKKYVESLDRYQRAVQVFRNLNPVNERDLANALYGQAVVHKLLGQWDKAASIMQESLNRYTSALGRDDARTQEVRQALEECVKELVKKNGVTS